MSAGQNGTVSLAGEPHFPAVEAGEDIAEGDVVGIKTISSRKVWAKALAAAGATQVEALGFAPMAALTGQKHKWSPQRYLRIALPPTLPAELTGLVPGDKVYVSATAAGGFTKTAPTGTGKIVQEVGVAFWDATVRLTGINASEAANAINCYILPATTL